MAKQYCKIYPAAIGETRVWERKDCVIRALSNASGMEYEKAHAMATKHGRQANKGTEIDVTHRLMLAAGLKAQGFYGTTGSSRWLQWRMPGVPHAAGTTLAKFVKNTPTGRYVVLVRGHALAVVDGETIDTHPTSGNMSVVAVYSV